MLNRREILHFGIAAGALAAASAVRAQGLHATSPLSAQALADRLVAAMGGRDHWARVKGLGIAARHHETELPLPHDNQLYIAMEEPRMRFEAHGEHIDQVRVVVADKGWYNNRRGPPVTMTPAQVKDDLDWWEAHVYRNVRRLALRDPGITPRLHSDGRLELIRTDGSRLMWYRLNQQSEPVSFGRFDAELGTVLGPLQEVAGGVRLPIFSASHDGAFRAVNQRPTAYTTVPPVDYDKP